MGGSGSGNFYHRRRPKKTTVEDCLSIDSNRLMREGILRPGVRLQGGMGEDRQLRQPGADLVVEIVRDPRAVAFDGLQKSNRHGSGFALRFPRIARIRDDKAPKDADTMTTVRALFETQVDSGHREPERQMGLFE